MNTSQFSTEVKKYIDIYDSYHFNLFLGTKLKDTIDVLMDNFDDEWGFPLEIDSDNPTYYSSVTSTILIALHHIRLLDSDFKNKVHESIFNLQNKSPNSNIKHKNPEDLSAWDVSESANCYSTALALQALLETNYEGDKINTIQDALIWLSQQQRPDGGWGFDNKCVSRVFFSAQIIHALDLGKGLFETNKKRKIEASVASGLTFIENEMHKDGEKFVYWSNASDKSTSDPTNTLYALWILQKHKRLDEETKNKSISFLRDKVNSDGIFDFVKIVEEIQSKYGAHKIIITFSPSAPLILLELGISPFDDLCLKHISWLKNNYKGNWSLPQYSPESLSFTYALGIWTLIEWQKHANKYIIRNKLQNECYNKMKNRINNLLLIIGILFIFIFNDLIRELLSKFYEIFTELINSYGYIGMFTSLITIYFFLPTIWKLVSKVFLYIDTKNKIRNFSKRAKKNIIKGIYGCK